MSVSHAVKPAGAHGEGGNPSFAEITGSQSSSRINIKKRISTQKLAPVPANQQKSSNAPGGFPRTMDPWTGGQPAVGFIVGPERGGRRKSNQQQQQASSIASGSSLSSRQNTVPVTSKSGCVAFQYETDGRSTFPSQKDFHDFCKQRDLFYGIKEIWTTQRSENSNQPVGQQSNYDPAYSKMKLLFQLNSTPTNMNRLAMLFLSQCILDSVFCGSQGGKTEPSSPSISSRTNLDNQKAEYNVRKYLQSNPSRLELLRNRVAPNPAVSEIDFIQINDPMAFLKYFVAAPGSTSSFTQYLIDHAIHELSEIENGLDTEGPPTDTKDALELIQKLMLLGKMLGYLFFLPYIPNVNSLSNQTQPNATTLEQQVSLRSHQGPPLDMFSILVKAFKQRRLVGTLPWVLEFLSQADPVMQHLPKYKSTIQLITLLYNKYLCEDFRKKAEIKEEMHLGIESANRRFLRIYAENLTRSLITSMGNEPASLNSATAIELETGLLHVKVNDHFESNDATNEALDSQKSIGETLMSIRFPSAKPLPEVSSVDDFPPLMAQPMPKVPDSPFPDRIGKKSTTIPAKRDSIQEALEIQFYKLHPPSLKKTIDFVADRVASIFLKNLRNSFLAKIKQETISAGAFQQEAVVLAKEKIAAAQIEFCPERCERALNELLDDGLSTGVKLICYSIAARKAETKIDYWVDRHVTKDVFPVVEVPEKIPSAKDSVTVEVKAPDSNEKDEKEKEESTSDDGPMRFECLILLKRSTQRLHLKQPLPTTTIDQILQNVHKIYNYKPWLRNFIINFAIALITFQPQDFTSTVQNQFIQIFKRFGWDVEEDPQKFLSARNLIIFSESTSPDQTWKAVEEFVIALLRNQLLSVKTLQEFSLMLLRDDWPPALFGYIQRLLASVKRESVVNDGSDEANVIEWTEWVYSGREDEYF